MFMSYIGFWILMVASIYINHCRSSQEIIYRTWSFPEFGKMGRYQESYYIDGKEFLLSPIDAYLYSLSSPHEMLMEYCDMLQLKGYSDKLICQCLYLQIDGKVIGAIEILTTEEWKKRLYKGLY